MKSAMMLPRLRRAGAACATVALMATTAAFAQAQPPLASGMPGGHHRLAHGTAEAPMLGEHALDAVGASAEQKARVREIFKAARDDLRQQREAGRALHQQMMALMSAPQIDPAAAEQLRQQQMARHDIASRRMLQAMLDAQAVLTPEQRQQLAERMKSRHEMMERHRRERRSLESPRG